MKKNGHDRLGRQRWMCPGCRTTGAVRDLSRRRRAELAEFLGWLLAPSPQPSGSRAFRKRTSWCWGLRPVLEPDAAARHVVMADGTYLKGGGCLLIVIDGLSGEVIAWQWCVRESTDEYTALFSRIPAPDVLVCDGLRGIEKACRRAWPGTRIQRCLVHVQRDSRRDLTSRPRLQAGRELKRLADTITGIHDTEQAAAWAVQLHEWHNRWRDMLAERTYAKDAPGDPRATGQEWWWTHQPLRRCYHRLESLLRSGSLFAFLDPALASAGPVPCTTNRLEGGINAPIKRMLVNHRGLPGRHRVLACEWACYMKSAKPDPYRFAIPDDTTPPAHAETDETLGGDAPKPGTSIEWTDLHMPVFNT